MKQFRKPKSQLFNALKRHFFVCELFSVGCFKQSNKTHNFRKYHFCDVITSELYFIDNSNNNRLQLGFYHRPCSGEPAFVSV